MKQAEMHFLQLHKQATHGHSKQSLAQTRYSPVTFSVNDTSIHEEQINQIKIQSRTNTVNPSICPRNETSKPSMKPINGDVPSVICSEVKAAEDEYLGKDKTMAANNLKHSPNDKESETETESPSVIYSEVVAAEDEY